MTPCTSVLRSSTATYARETATIPRHPPPILDPPSFRTRIQCSQPHLSALNLMMMKRVFTLLAIAACVSAGSAFVPHGGAQKAVGKAIAKRKTFVPKKCVYLGSARIGLRGAGVNHGASFMLDPYQWPRGTCRHERPWHAKVDA